jgi:hypothetical protein
MTAMPRLAQKSAILQNWYSESENIPCRPTRQGTADEADVEAEIEIGVGSVDRGTMNRAYTVSPKLLYLTSYSSYQGEDPNRTCTAARGASES